jgi:4-amino-4-deoxychorismate lyase
VVNGKLINLKWHQNRFEASYFKFYKELTNIKLNKVIQVPDEHSNGLVKLRFLYNKTDCFCQFDTYEKKSIKTLKLVENNDINYSLKFVDRSKLQELLKQKDKADEILIVKNGLITDTSFTNIAFFDGSQWFTPQFPLLHGTARARLLFEKKIIAKSIRMEDLSSYQYFKLFNAMIDFEEAKFQAIENIL